MRIAITGATGFIGRHLGAHLAANGHAVRALVRQSASGLRGAGRLHHAPGGWPAGVDEHPVADLFDLGAVARAVAGCDAVVHLAGRAHVLRERAADPAAEFQHVNAVGTSRACEAAATAGARTFVLLSSVAAVAAADAGRVDDGTRPHPSTPYGESKLSAERLAFAVADARGMRAIALRPPMVYGPGMKGNPLRLFRLVDRGLPLPLGAIHNRRSMLYVEHLVSAVATAIDVPTLPTGAYLVADDAAPSTPEFVRGIAHALGRPARLIGVWPALLRGLGLVGDHLAPTLAVPITSATFESLLGTLVVDDARFRALTGWRPSQALAAALRRTAEWFRTGESAPGRVARVAGPSADAAASAP